MRTFTNPSFDFYDLSCVLLLFSIRSVSIIKLYLCKFNDSFRFTCVDRSLLLPLKYIYEVSVFKCFSEGCLSWMIVLLFKVLSKSLLLFGYESRPRIRLKVDVVLFFANEPDRLLISQRSIISFKGVRF